MVSLSAFIRAVFGAAAILSSVVLGIAFMSNTYAASTANFNKQCKVATNNSSTKGLAVVGATENACTCISKSGRRILRPPTVAAAAEECNTLTPQKTTNFNQPTPPSAGPGPGPAPGPGPGPGPGPTAKGNNGWGQEKHGRNDGTNNGSFHGNDTQQGSKTTSTER
jgi:hypothetical protein